MNSLDGAIITVLNWEKYNPRKDIKATHWVRLQNSLFEDPNFFDFNHSELLFWIYLLSMGSKKMSGQIRLSLKHAERIGRFELGDIQSAIEKLIELGCIELNVTQKHVTPETNEANADVTPTSRARTATNERNERDVTNVTNTYADPNVGARVHFDFEKIYLEYPRKEGKQEGLKVCKARIKTQEDYEQLLSAVRRYRAHCEREGIEKQYIKHFSSFLNKDRWKDWLDPDTGTGIEITRGGKLDDDYFSFLEEDSA